MLADPKVASDARALFHSDEVAHCHLADGFTLWHGCLHYVSGRDGKDHPALADAQQVAFDLWSLLTVFYRTDWQADLVAEGILPGGIWREFISSDVEHFHTTLRSLFDHAAGAIIAMAPRSGQIPDRFKQLRSWATEQPRASDHIGADVVALLRSCDWFEEIRRVRDLIVHGKSLTVGFIVDSRPCFQVVSGPGLSVLQPGLMPNQNVVDFRLYAAAVMSHLLLFLDHLGTIGLGRLSSTRPCPQAAFAHYALSTVRRWIDELITTIGAA